MTRNGTTTLQLSRPRSHALRDVGFVALLMLAIAAFVANAIRF
jgi:hypothetical protein